MLSGSGEVYQAPGTRALEGLGDAGCYRGGRSIEPQRSATGLANVPDDDDLLRVGNSLASGLRARPLWPQLWRRHARDLALGGLDPWPKDGSFRLG